MKTTKKKYSMKTGKTSYSAMLLCRRGATYWENFTKGFALVMLLVFPLLMGLNGYTAITEGKYILFKILTFCYVGGALLIFGGYFLEKNAWRVRKAEGFQRLTLPQILLLAFTAWGVVCALVSPYTQLWEGQSRYEGVLSMLLYTAIFVLVAFWGEYSAYYLPAMAVMALAQGVVSLLQISGVDLIYPEGYNYASTAFVGMLGNIDCMGGLVAIALPALACGFILLEGRWRYVMLSGAAILLAVEILIDVDSAKMGLLAALVVSVPFLVTERRHLKNTLCIGAVLLAVFGLCRWIRVGSFGKLVLLSFIAAVLFGAGSFLLGKFQKPFGWSKKKICLLVVAAEVVFAVAALLYLRGYSGSNLLLSDIRDVLHGNLTDGAGSGRGAVWKSCLLLMAASPVFGCGPGAFLEAFGPYNRPEWGVVFDFAHNDFLQVGVCMGYVGLALYVAFIIVLAVRAFRNGLRCPLVVIFASAAAGYLVHSFFSFSIAIVTPIFWVMAGLLEKLIRQLPPVEKTAKKEK